MSKNFLCAISVAIALVCMLASCGGTNNSENHEHNYGSFIVEKVASCTEDGVKAQYCNCGAKRTTTTAAYGHSFAKWETITEATCEENGSRERICKCGAKETEVIEAFGHNDSNWLIDTEATCTVEGLRHKACTVCNKTTVTETITKLEHTEGEWIIDIESTCTEDGSRHKACSVCNETTVTEIIAKLEHTEGEWVIDIDATCTESGSRHQLCLVCGESIKTEETPSKGHIFNEWAVTKNATCEEEGVKERACKCGEKEISTFKAEHNLIYTSAREDSDNFFATYYCEICDFAIEKQISPIVATCNFYSVTPAENGFYVGYLLAVSGGTGSYSFNVIAAVNTTAQQYQVIYGNSQSGSAIFVPVSTELLNSFRAVMLRVWIMDEAGFVAYDFYFSNFFSDAYSTSIYTPYGLRT